MHNFERIIIVCEGQTEQEFCKSILRPYFMSRDIEIQTPLIKKSMGGIVHWESLKKQIETHLKVDKNCRVSTFIDYYGIKSHHQFPNWATIHSNYQNKMEMIIALENAIFSDLNKELSYRFIPYIQLHEFEALLLIEYEAFEKNIPPKDFKKAPLLKELIDKNPNPELVNDKKESSPSARLKDLIAGYNKLKFANIIASELGIDKIRHKCLHFNAWIIKMEDK